MRLTGKTSEGLTTPWTSLHKNLCDTPLVVSVIHMCEVGCGHLTKMYLREVAGGSRSTLLQIEVPRSLRNLVCGQSLEIGALNRSLGLCWRLVFPGQGQARHSSHRVFLWVSHQARWSILAVTILAVVLWAAVRKHSIVETVVRGAHIQVQGWHQGLLSPVQSALLLFLGEEGEVMRPQAWTRRAGRFERQRSPWAL